MSKPTTQRNSLKIVHYSCYKRYIDDWVAGKPHNGHGQFKRMAQHIHMHTTQFSQIVRGDKHFSPEQAVGLTEFLELIDLEQEYFVTLVISARSGSQKLRNVVERRLVELREQSDKISHRMRGATQLTDVEQARFYSSWQYSAIRLAASMPGTKTSQDIAAYLNLHEEVVYQVLAFLLEKRLVIVKDGDLALGPAHTHVGKDSAFVGLHHRNWRTKALSHLDHVRQHELSFTAPVSLSRRDFAVIRNELLQLIDGYRTTVGPSAPEMLAFLNIDWLELGGEGREVDRD